MSESVTLPEEFLNKLSFVLKQEELAQFKDSLLQPASLSIRFNPFKQTEHDTLRSIPWCASGFYLEERPSFTLDPLFHAGSYYVQEASSMFLEQIVTHSINTNKGLKVLDLCAAPGGKSTHLLSLLNQQSLLISNEVIRSRAGILVENVKKWGSPNVLVTHNDPSHFKSLEGFFDVIIVDAPCSGEGLFRKEPEAINEWSADNVALCSQRQKRILADVLPALKHRGILIYSTCTYNRKENEENLQWLEEQQNIEFIKIPLDPKWGVEEIREGKILGYRFFPHRVQGEGFFISAVRKLSTDTEVRIKTKSQIVRNKKVNENIKSWIRDNEEFDFILLKENIKMIVREFANEIEFLSGYLNIIQTGTSVGSFKHDKLIPDHALALSTSLDLKNIKTIEVGKEDALKYLRKDQFDINDNHLGFALVTYQGIGLGWINSLNTRFNNLYPVNWRIRMR